MKKTLLLLAAFAAVSPIVRGADTESVPAFVIAGTKYKLPRSEYTLINVNHDGTYTFVSNISAERDVTISSTEGPDINLESVPRSEITNLPTSVETIGADNHAGTLVFDGLACLLRSQSMEDLEVVVYDISGRAVLTGHIGVGGMSVSRLPEGAYIVVTQGSRTVNSLKFVKR
ncbi:MAG: T9SS type A sorting domain-containing protein [Bacteroidales bacterium]|nr:T9SS type A sorting domain-containing protein [Bacteroidales bacterium]